LSSVGARSAGLLLCLCRLASASNGDGRVHADLDSSRRTYAVEAPDVITFRSGFAATIERDDQRKILSSSEGELKDGAIRFSDEGVDLLFRMEQPDGVSGVLAQVGIRNHGSSAFQLVALTAVNLEGRVAGNAWEWLVTALDRSAKAEAPVVAVGDVGDALSIHEYGGLYRRDGAGVFFGPVGTPTAYLVTRIEQRGDGKVSMRISADMSSVSVEPGEVRWGQQVVLLMESPATAVARWAEWVAETHGARTAMGALTGWRFPNEGEYSASGVDFAGIVDAVRASPERLRPDVIQVDPKLDATEGLAGTSGVSRVSLVAEAWRISSLGARPGLRMRLHGMQTGASDAWADLAQRARQAVENGYSYLEIDGSTLSDGDSAHDRKTLFEARREGFMRLREAIGNETYLLYVGDSPDRATLGAVDASRTGSHVGRHSVRLAINDVLRSYALNDRWFAVDNDVFFMETFGVWPLARTWMSMVGLSCGAAITSDPWQRGEFRSHRRSVEVMTPPAHERTVVLDLCSSRHWPRLVSKVTREWGEYAVVLLWNPGAVEQSISLDFAEAGLDPKRRYAVWSFWDNRFLGVTKGSWTTPSLAPATSQHLRFTDLDADPGRPVVIGSSLHIFCGAAEIADVKRTADLLQIELTDAGAREGELFVYSRWPPFLKSSVGCTATTVDSAGENVWRIGLEKREVGVPQRLELGVLLPTTRRSWFWLLIAIVVVSVLLAAWRYIVGLRLQRASELEQERTRIAGDIHDEVGANLTQMSILSSLAARPTTTAEDARSHNLEMLSVARQTIQALEEIVWSINPKGDSLKSLADFLCRRAEEILELGEIACRIELEEDLPNRRVTPRRRHGLVLAFKEAVHNVLKHAGATRVTIQCGLTGGVFEVAVSDDGCGFDATSEVASTGRQGNGLGNMRRRLEDLGGEFRIESRSDEGTKVCFRLPLD
jgi:signal transduction histidine kinase